MSRGFKPIYIVAQSIEIGDTVNIVYKEYKGVTVSKVAKVAKREHEGHDAILYTVEGYEIMRYSATMKPQRITLLNRVDRQQTLLPLFDL